MTNINNNTETIQQSADMLCSILDNMHNTVKILSKFTLFLMTLVIIKLKVYSGIEFSDNETISTLLPKILKFGGVETVIIPYILIFITSGSYALLSAIPNNTIKQFIKLITYNDNKFINKLESSIKNYNFFIKLSVALNISAIVYALIVLLYKHSESDLFSLFSIVLSFLIVATFLHYLQKFNKDDEYTLLKHLTKKVITHNQENSSCDTQNKPKGSFYSRYKRILQFIVLFFIITFFILFLISRR